MLDFAVLLLRKQVVDQDNNAPSPLEPSDGNNGTDDSLSSDQIAERIITPESDTVDALPDVSTLDLPTPPGKYHQEILAILSQDNGQYSSRELLPGDRIGSYLLVERLGRGGQGEVWRATQIVGIIRSVALKILHPHLAVNPIAAQRFRDEANHGGRLVGSGIVPVFEFGSVGDQSFIAMQLIEGFNLGTIVLQRVESLRSEQPMSKVHPLATISEADYLDRVTHVMARIARAVQIAHHANIVHRDIKPSNILLAHNALDDAYLSDFGLAHQASELKPLGHYHSGTISYMAPEKLRSASSDRPIEGPKINEYRCDVYSLGASLHEAATLAKPFVKPSGMDFFEWALKRPKELTCLPRVHRPKISRDLEAIILKAMALDPEQRYATPEEFAKDLDRFRTREPVKARPPGPWRRTWITIKRHRVAALALASLLGVALAVITVLRLVQSLTAQRAEDLREQAATQLERDQLEDAVRLATLAEALAPDHPDTIELLSSVSESLMTRLEEDAWVDSTRTAWHWYQLWLGLKPRRQTERMEFVSAHGFKQLVLYTDRPHASAAFRPLLPNGAPVSGPPLFTVSLPRVGQPINTDWIIPGRYWISVTCPSGAFIERPILINRSPSIARYEQLQLHPRTNAELGDQMIRIPVPEPRTRKQKAQRWPTRLAPFYLDRTEVTNRSFLEFLEATDNLVLAASIWPDSENRPREKDMDKPVTNISINLAHHYAAWRGCRLPTDAELAYVAKLGLGNAATGPEPGSSPEHLQVVGTDPDDQIYLEEGMIAGLKGNAAEFTLLRFSTLDQLNLGHGRPDPAFQSWTSTWYGYPTRWGLIDASYDDSPPILLGPTDRPASMLPDQRNQFVGFRCARSAQPRFDLNN